ncbi:hypothetical protein L195_g031465 [Trifolium pratense]|uniref:Uncharacterized protein n=1 Tax=Trifolium pratense TaxID=57577 RepID=A0A2K3LAG7_TRIPR|nr:hypothetical protein L195_g031465 [Trifolium pratense]
MHQGCLYLPSMLAVQAETVPSNLIRHVVHAGCGSGYSMLFMPIVHSWKVAELEEYYMI